jgi:hypothetical protein
MTDLELALAGAAALRTDLAQRLDTIRNQNREMEWLKSQLRESGARERAYVEIINTVTGAIRGLAEDVQATARAVLEGTLERPSIAVTDALQEPGR